MRRWVVFGALVLIACTCVLFVIAKVQSAAVAGLTAYVWQERESGIVDRCACQLLRKLTRGAAVEENENEMITCSLSNREHVFRMCFRIVVPHFEGIDGEMTDVPHFVE